MRLSTALLCLLSALLVGCGDRPCWDPGTAHITCTYAYTTNGVTDAGEYASVDMSCVDYANYGDQTRSGVESACASDGDDAGADEVECLCERDVSACHFPCGAND